MFNSLKTLTRGRDFSQVIISIKKKYFRSYTFLYKNIILPKVKEGRKLMLRSSKKQNHFFLLKYIFIHKNLYKLPNWGLEIEVVKYFKLISDC